MWGQRDELHRNQLSHQARTAKKAEAGAVPANVQGRSQRILHNRRHAPKNQNKLPNKLPNLDRLECNEVTYGPDDGYEHDAVAERIVDSVDVTRYIWDRTKSRR
mmetsp:Transcript_6252/g.14247  ORF Transcript_6252/g.14247 Transcript_6252/m.14247 type:complete len:104 (-) Transcript_6252:143-454(-)